MMKTVRADRFRKTAIAQGRWICIPLNRSIVHDLINLISGDAWPYVRSCDVQYFTSYLRHQALSIGVLDKENDGLCKLFASFLALRETISLGAGLKPSARASVFLLLIRAMHRTNSHSSTNRQGCILVAEYAPEPGAWQTEDTWAAWAR